MHTRQMPLSALPIGGVGEVLQLQVDEQVRRRLVDLGLLVGSSVQALYRAPSGDPTAYLIRGTVIALRRRDAAHILVREAAGT